MEQLVSYRKLTSSLFGRLKNMRDDFFKVVKIPYTTNYVRDVLIQLLEGNPNGSAYSEWIQGKRPFMKIYRDLT
jgi:hypothetical protein